MPYPWPSFGDFYFAREERALDGLGGVWSFTPSEARSRALGSLFDTVVTLSYGSQQREFSVYLSPSRLIELRSLVTSTAIFTDWDSPVPDSRIARLDGVDAGENVAVDCQPYGGTDRRVLCTIRLTSQ